MEDIQGGPQPGTPRGTGRCWRRTVPCPRPARVCRSKDWTKVRRLLGAKEEARLAASGVSGWFEALPPTIETAWPVGRAGRARRPATMADQPPRFAPMLTPGGVRAGAGRDPLAGSGWPSRALDPFHLPCPSRDASGVLRAGLVRDPATVAREHRRDDEPDMAVARGLLALASGDVAQARRLLDDAADRGEVNPVAGAAARLGAAVAAVLAGSQPDARAFERAVEEAERAGAPWLARLGRELGRRLGAAGQGTAGQGTAGRGTAGRVLGRSAGRAARVSSSASRLAEDVGSGVGDDPAWEPWTEALLALAAAWAGPHGAEDALDEAETAAEAFRRLGAAVPEAWARAIAALAAGRLGTPDARDSAAGAESLGHTTGTPGARALARAAMAIREGGNEDDLRLLAEAAADAGLALPVWTRPARPAMAPVGPGQPAGPETLAAAMTAGPVGLTIAASRDQGAARHRAGTQVRCRLLGGCVPRGRGAPRSPRRGPAEGSLAPCAARPPRRRARPPGGRPGCPLAGRGCQSPRPEPARRALRPAPPARRRRRAADSRLVARRGRRLRLDVRPGRRGPRTLVRSPQPRAAKARARFPPLPSRRRSTSRPASCSPNAVPRSRSGRPATTIEHPRSRLRRTGGGGTCSGGVGATACAPAGFGLEIRPLPGRVLAVADPGQDRLGTPHGVARPRQYALVLEALAHGGIGLRRQS